MKKIKCLYASMLALSTLSSGAAAPTPPVRFAPATIGTTKYEIFSFVRFGVVPVGSELSPTERRALVELVKAKDTAGLIVNSGLDAGQQFSLSLPPLQQKSYRTLAPKLMERFTACIKAMPEASALHLIAGISGIERLKDATINAQIKTDFDAAVGRKCATPANDLNTKPYEERALAGVESLLTGELSIWLGGDNYIALLQSIGDSTFGKPNAIFGDVAYDYLKTTMTAVIAGMSKIDGISQITRPEGFSTFIDFLVVAKTKTSMPTGVIEAISEKCLAGVPDLFKPFSLSACGSDTYSLRTLAIGDTEGTLVSGVERI